MNIIKAALVAAATIAAAVVVPVPAHADADYQQFASPSGNIRCLLLGKEDGPTPIAMCQISDHTYVIPQGVAKAQDGGPCEEGTAMGRDFRVDQGKQAYPTCTYSAIASGFGPWPALAYGQSKSLDALTCASAPSGITCTDTGDGHFFRVSRDSYEIG